MSLGVYQVQVMADGYAAAWSKEIRVENAEVKTDAQIKLTAGGTLSGIIVDPSGKPVEGAKVSPFSIAGYASPSPIEHFQPDMGAVKTDASGRFTLSHLVGGDEKLRIVHPDFARQDNRQPESGRWADGRCRHDQAERRRVGPGCGLR